jgi:hypothetical protein
MRAYGDARYQFNVHDAPKQVPNDYRNLAERKIDRDFGLSQDHRPFSFTTHTKPCISP